MAKKSRADEPPNPSSVANRDMLQRMNFLYQASALLQTASIPSFQAPVEKIFNVITGASDTDPISGGSKLAERSRKRRRILSASDVSRSYVHDMRQVSQKATVRMDPSVKRTMCRGCDTILIPGVSSRVRVAGSGPHGEVLVTHCLSCRTARRVPASPAPFNRTAVAQMDVGSVPTQGERRRKRRGPQTRPPPLFEREGHVVFRGSEQISP